jgi:hypothetical protein
VLGLAAVEDGVQPAGVGDDHRSIPAAPRPPASAASISAAVAGAASRIPKCGRTGLGLLGEDAADALADQFGL